TANLVDSGIPLVSTRMAVGAAVLTTKPTAINQDLKALYPADGVEARFLIRVLKALQPRLEAVAVGSTVKGIRLDQLTGAPVLLPTLPEQRRIAEVLDAVDQAIQQTEALIAKLEQVKAGLLHDLLTRGLDEHGELRDPVAHPEQFRDSPLGRIPKPWSIEPIAALLADVEPAMRSGPFGSELLASELVSEGIPLLGIDNVYPERFVSRYIRFVSRSKFLQLRRYAVRPNDVMITIMGTVGRSCLVPEGIGDALSSKHVWTLTLDPNRYSPV